MFHANFVCRWERAVGRVDCGQIIKCPVYHAKEYDYLTASRERLKGFTARE